MIYQNTRSRQSASNRLVLVWLERLVASEVDNVHSAFFVYLDCISQHPVFVLGRESYLHLLIAKVTTDFTIVMVGKFRQQYLEMIFFLLGRLLRGFPILIMTFKLLWDPKASFCLIFSLLLSSRLNWSFTEWQKSGHSCVFGDFHRFKNTIHIIGT